MFQDVPTTPVVLTKVSLVEAAPAAKPAAQPAAKPAVKDSAAQQPQ
jgi:hypothetical protein